MIIEFGTFNYKLLLFLLYPIFYQLPIFITRKDTPPLYDSFMGSINYLSAGLIYLIVLHRSNIIKKSSNLKKFEGKPVAVNEVYIENQNFIKKRKIKEIIFIFFLSFIYPIPIFLESLAKKQIYSTLTSSIGILIYILYYVAFSYLILNSKIYKHQIISLAIIFFCLLLCSFIDIFQITKDSFNFNRFWISILYLLVALGLFSVYDTLIKKYFRIYSENPYKLMFYIGLFSILLIVPLDLFLYFCNIKIFDLDIINQIIELFSSSPIYILWFIFDIISGLLYEIGMVLIIYYYTPSHIIIYESLCEFLTRCIGWITGVESEIWYVMMIHVFLYFIVFFLSLIYNEVIIIKLFNMEENTYKYISQRQKMEFEDIQNAYEEGSSAGNTGQSFELIEDDGENEERERNSDL